MIMESIIVDGTWWLKESTLFMYHIVLRGIWMVRGLMLEKHLFNLSIYLLVLNFV